MKILMISSTRLGDAVLSTGLLDYLTRTYPTAEITVAAGKLGMGLFEQFPTVTQTLIVEKRPYKAHWFDLWKKAVTTRWDIVVDLRGSIIPYTVWTKKRFVWNKKGKQGLHKVEQLARVMGLNPPPAPILYFKPEIEAQAKAMLPTDGFILGVGPAANFIGKSWPTERFIELIQRLRAEHPAFTNCYLAVFAAPGEEAMAKPVLDAVEPAKQLDFIGKTKPVMAAALLKQCDFYIGNDSGLMHSAAAVGTPTLGLFGPSPIKTYAPWGKHTHTAQTDESFEELCGPGFNSDAIKDSMMKSLSVGRAYNAAIALFEKTKA